MVRIGLTGTPGVGKTTVAALLAASGIRVVDVGAWAAEVGCVVGRDEQDDAAVVDIDALADQLPDDDGTPVVYDGHLSHLLGADAAWILRADPLALLERLKARGYTRGKIIENAEAEAMDLILQEALDTDADIKQVDTTGRTPEEVVQILLSSLTGAFKHRDIEDVDWSDRLPITGA